MKWVSFISSTNRRMVIRAAQNDLEACYLSGETGTGKSAIARWIHENSPRSTKPFIVLESGSSLFEKATQAGDGTLLIQDLESFASEEQNEIIRFIRSHSISDGFRGGVRTLVRARVIATGDHALDEFSRFDSVFKDSRIHLPSLNIRGSELLDIIENLFNEMAHEMKRDHVRSITPAALEKLTSHVWRGNLRELRNILRFGILSTQGSAVDVEHLPDLEDPDGLLLQSRASFKNTEDALRKRLKAE